MNITWRTPPARIYAGGWGESKNRARLTSGRLR